MSRYFIEVAYKGAGYAGFQVQQNANSIQAEVEKAFHIFFRDIFQFTCSSRTDAGVHALSNYFHFDTSSVINSYSFDQLNAAIYNLNAILPEGIVVRKIFRVADTAHCRFDAISREYKYYIYQQKNPFFADRAYFYPYKLDLGLLQDAADMLIRYDDFSSFSKKNTQVKSFICRLKKCRWSLEQDSIVFTVEGNRFLRGMVRGLVGTMLKVGTGKISLPEFKNIIEQKSAASADFSVPAHGLFLIAVQFDTFSD
jgi:tRNA pseudouridine38-40 synthase